MRNFRVEDTILYEDNELLVCRKPAGIAVQNARLGTMDMESALKNYLAAKKPGKVPYLGVVHRLDQPVEGILVFAKTPAAAKSLSGQMAQGGAGKIYLAVTAGKPPAAKGVLEDFLKKDGKTNMSRVVKEGTPGAKKARLCYQVLEEKNGEGCLLYIKLETGRHHQIRVQMAHAGMPLRGDQKYNAGESAEAPLALCACRLSFRHPRTGKIMEFCEAPQGAAFGKFPDILLKIREMCHIEY